MVTAGQISAFVREVADELAHSPDGLPGRLPPWVAERFSRRFLRQLAPNREVGQGVVITTPTWEAPTKAQLDAMDAEYLAIRRARYGAVVDLPAPVRTRWSRVPDLVRDILGRK
jgi:hypothetical protein